jgi:hypothetical protein
MHTDIAASMVNMLGIHLPSASSLCVVFSGAVWISTNVLYLTEHAALNYTLFSSSQMPICHLRTPSDTTLKIPLSSHMMPKVGCKGLDPIREFDK